MNKKIIKNFLEKYTISDEVSIKKFSDGITETSFSVNTKNKNYVLKMITNDNKLENMLFRVNYVNYLCTNKFPTNKIIKNKDGQFLTKNNEHAGLLMEYVEGNTIPWEKITETTAKELAFFVSSLYKLSLKYYKKNVSLNSNDKYALRIDKIVKKNIDFINIRKSIIHSDISRENVIINKEKIQAIIDFDDLQVNYLVWDYATLLTQIFVTRTYGIDWDALMIFHTEFVKNFKWNKDELAIIVPLMLHRNKLIYKEFSNKSIPNKKIQSIMKSVEYKIKLIKKDSDNLNNIFLPLN